MAENFNVQTHHLQGILQKFSTAVFFKVKQKAAYRAGLTQFFINTFMSNRPMIVDDGFIQRVRKTSLLVSLFIIILSLSYRDSAITLGLLLGVSISLTFFELLCWTVNRFFSSKLHMRKKVFFAMKITLLKYPLLGAILYYVLRYVSINPLALIVGLGIVQAVMVLKVVGILFVNYINPLART